ncbi:MAG: hypothetical protein ABSA75_15225 [Candidatus Bathyarchaeia archaeon]|jgi:hypothetical protein
MSKPLTTPKSANRNRNIGIAVAVIVIVLIAVVAGFYVFKGSGSTGALLQTPTSTPALTPTPTLVASNIQVSGTVHVAGLEIQPTQIEFVDAANNSLKYTAIVQKGFYNISLPSQQTYGIAGTWGGLTFNATGIPMGAIDVGTLNLNVGVGVTSITQDLPAPNPSPPASITQNLPAPVQPP